MLSRGVAYMIASAAAFSVMSALVNAAARELPLGEIVLARGIITLALSYLAVRNVPNLWGTNRRGLAARGLLGFLGLTCYYIGLARLPIAEATTINHTVPLATTILAWHLLGERPGVLAVVALVVGFAGVAVISRPTHFTSADGLDPLGVGVVLIGAWVSALAYVQVRRLTATEDARVIVFYFPLLTVPLAVPWALADLVVPSALEVAALAAIGISTQLGQVFLTRGLALESAGVATSIGYVQVAFALGWSILLFHHTPPASTWIGVAMIGVAVSLVAAERRGPTKRTDRPAARRAGERADVRATRPASPEALAAGDEPDHTS